MARGVNPFPHGSVRNALYEVLSRPCCVQGMHISCIKEEVVAMRAADESIWPNFPKAKTPESTISAALSTSGGIFEKVGPATYRVNFKNVEMAQKNHRVQDGRRSKFVLQPTKRKAEVTGEETKNTSKKDSERKEKSTVKKKKVSRDVDRDHGKKETVSKKTTEPQVGLCGDGSDSAVGRNTGANIGFRPYEKLPPITAIFPYQKATVFKRTDSPLCVVELGDIINEKVFQEFMTEEEQDSLLQYLPRVDVVKEDNVNPSQAFRSSDRLKETFGEFQELLNRGIFDNDAGYPPGVARHYTEILYNTDLHKIDWWGRKPVGRLSNRRALTSNPLSDLHLKYEAELQGVRNLFGKVQSA